MNRNLALFAWLLAGLLILNVLLNGFLVMQQMMLYRTLETKSAQINQSQIGQTENLIRSLMGDLMAYGQKQPAIYEVLKKYGVNPPAPNSPPTAAPAQPPPSPKAKK